MLYYQFLNVWHSLGYLHEMIKMTSQNDQAHRWLIARRTEQDGS